LMSIGSLRVEALAVVALPSRTLADGHGTRRARQRHRPPRVGVVLLADLDQVDGPRESRMVRVRWFAGGDPSRLQGAELGEERHSLPAPLARVFSQRPPGALGLDQSTESWWTLGWSCCDRQSE
jgi:hypothetical protein